MTLFASALLVASLVAHDVRVLPLVASHDPATAAAELLDADRRLGREASTRDFGDAFAALLAEDAIMPAPALGGFAEGREAILGLLLRDTLNLTSRVEWTPARAGVSADGTQGLTIGTMRVTRADGRRADYKYLAYWIRRDGRWQVRVWRRVPRAAERTDASTAAGNPAASAQQEGEGSSVVAPWLPRVAAQTFRDAAAHAQAQRELQGMEQIFSDSAARIGIGPAFAALGADDAWHLGAPTEAGFNRGNAVIAQAVQGNAPAGTSPVTWSAERAILAPSGDLGVTLGYIVPNAPAPDGSRRPFPFFTIWRRDASGWKFIAE